MTNLKGNSLLFLKIRGGSIDEAASYLRNRPDVKQVNRLLGHWDLLVSGNFPNYESFRTFAEEIETKPYCERVSTYPCFKEWTRKKSPETPVTGWAMIGTNNTEETFEKLKDSEHVYWMGLTSGDYNIVLHMGAKKLEDLSSFIESEVRQLPGVKRTETHPSFKY